MAKSFTTWEANVFRRCWSVYGVNIRSDVRFKHRTHRWYKNGWTTDQVLKEIGRILMGEWFREK